MDSVREPVRRMDACCDDCQRMVNEAREERDDAVNESTGLKARVAELETQVKTATGNAMGYRDQLATAQARIVELEGELKFECKFSKAAQEEYHKCKDQLATERAKREEAEKDHSHSLAQARFHESRAESLERELAEARAVVAKHGRDKEQPAFEQGVWALVEKLDQYNAMHNSFFHREARQLLSECYEAQAALSYADAEGGE